MILSRRLVLSERLVKLGLGEPPPIVAAERVIELIVHQTMGYSKGLRKMFLSLDRSTASNHTDRIQRLTEALLTTKEPEHEDNFRRWLVGSRLSTMFGTALTEILQARSEAWSPGEVCQSIHDSLELLESPELESTRGEDAEIYRYQIFKLLDNEKDGPVNEIFKIIANLNFSRATGNLTLPKASEALELLEEALRIPTVRAVAVRNLLKVVLRELRTGVSANHNYSSPSAVHRLAPQQKTAVGSSSEASVSQYRETPMAGDLSTQNIETTRVEQDANKIITASSEETASGQQDQDKDQCSHRDTPYSRYPESFACLSNCSPFLCVTTDSFSRRIWRPKTSRDEIQNAVGRPSEEVDSHPQPSGASDCEVSSPLVLIEEGFDIRSFFLLEEYFNAYKSTPRAIRRLEHSDPTKELWPPLIPAGLRIGCGRPECTADLSRLDRSERICPGCNQPILSRCGNSVCQEDFLHLEADGKEQDCQACGNPNANLYWSCPEHPDRSPLSTIDDPCCPECIYRWGWRRRPRRQDRISKGVLRCPGCLVAGLEAPLLVPHRLREDFCAENLLDPNTGVKDRLAAANLPLDGRCPQCSGQLIPLDDERGCGAPVSEPKARPLACGYCDFPLDPTANHCPRCTLRVADCPVCAHLPPHGSQFAGAKPPATWIRRNGLFLECDRCGTRQVSLRHRNGLIGLDGSVCSNIYGCPVGGLLESPEVMVLLPSGCSCCPICEDTRQPPVDIRAFVGDLLRCTYCRHAMGDPRDWSSATLAGPTALNGNLPAVLSKIADQEHKCRFCGRGPGKSGGEANVLEEVEAAALELSRALWIGKQPEAAHRLTDHWRILRPDWPRHKRREAADLLIDRTDTRLHPRLSSRIDELLRLIDPRAAETNEA